MILGEAPHDGSELLPGRLSLSGRESITITVANYALSAWGLSAGRVEGDSRRSQHSATSFSKASSSGKAATTSNVSLEDLARSRLFPPILFDTVS